jgi:AsmA protein
MKRFLAISAAFVAAVVLAVGLFYAFLPREALQTRLGEILASWTGRDVTLRGEPRVELLPRLTVTLHDVTVSGPPTMEDADLIHMDWLRGTIRLLPLLIGRVEIDSFKMKRPVLMLVRDGTERNWHLDSGAAALQLAFAGDVPLGEFEVEDGTIVYEDRASGQQETLDDVRLELDWQSIRTPIALTGSGLWRGETLGFDARAEAPFDFLNDKPTPFSATLESRPLSAILTGSVAELENPGFTGELDMTVPSIGVLAEWFGATAGPGAYLGEATLSGAATLTSTGLGMEGAQLGFGGGTANGALQVTFGKRPHVAGTLAFDQIDLTSQLQGIATLWQSRNTDWRTIPVNTAWLRGLEADLRISADTVRIGSGELRSTAATLSLASARLEVGLAHAGLEGGGLAGTVSLSDFRDAETSATEVAIRATDFEIDAMASALGLPIIASGSTTLVTDLSSSGRTFGALAENLVGSAGVTVLEGTIRDPGFSAIAAGTEPAGNGGRPTVPFDRLEARIAFTDGAAMLESSVLRTPQFSAEMTGRMEIADGTLGLSGIVETAQAPRTFLIGGTISSPQVTPAAASQ